jgi:hypothetical protein
MPGRWIRFAEGSQWQKSPPIGSDKSAVEAFESLRNALIRDGWEPTGEVGQAWWMHHFRRRVDVRSSPPSGSGSEGALHGDDASGSSLYQSGDMLQARENLWLYGGEKAPDTNAVIMLIESGTPVRVLEVGQDWIKVKTEEGDAGFIVADDLYVRGSAS